SRPPTPCGPSRTLASRRRSAGTRSRTSSPATSRSGRCAIASRASATSRRGCGRARGAWTPWSTPSRWSARLPNASPRKRPREAGLHRVAGDGRGRLVVALRARRGALVAHARAGWRAGRLALVHRRDAPVTAGRRAGVLSFVPGTRAPVAADQLRHLLRELLG